jgi:hypothetical protein
MSKGIAKTAWKSGTIVELVEPVENVSFHVEDGRRRLPKRLELVKSWQSWTRMRNLRWVENLEMVITCENHVLQACDVGLCWFMLVYFDL